jgi:hypothetical protein
LPATPLYGREAPKSKRMLALLTHAGRCALPVVAPEFNAHQTSVSPHNDAMPNSVVKEVLIKADPPEGHLAGPRRLLESVDAEQGSSQ